MSVGSSFGGQLFERLARGSLVEARSGRRLVGAALSDQVRSTARHLRDSCVDLTRPVLLVVDGSLDAAVAYLSALVAGRLVLPLDSRDWKHRGPDLLRLCPPDLVWAPSKLALRADGVRVAHGLEGLADIARVGGDAHTSGHATSADATDGEFARPAVVALMPTSGSTGTPLLVQVTSQNLLANTQGIVQTQRLAREDSALLCLSLGYCFGASVLHSHLWVGGSVVLDDRLMFPEKVLDSLAEHGCTSFAGVPTTYHFLARHSRVLSRAFPALRRWLQAGGHLDAPTVKQFRDAFVDARFFVMYGQTEATARITTMEAGAADPQGCVGHPLPELHVEVRDDDLQRVPRGTEGELWVSGPSVCAGYWSNDVRSGEKFHGAWLRTGDVALLLPDGRVCLRGRRDAFIKVRGRRIGAVEIEDTVRRLTGCEDCCAVPLPHRLSGEVIGLWIVPAAEQPELVEGWRDELPKHWDIGAVVVEAGLPLTVNGKPDRRRVVQRLQESAA